MKKIRLYMILAVMIAAAFVLAGCGGGGNNSGTGTLRVSLMDAPLDADKIYVDITSVQVHSDTEGWVTVKEFTPAQHVNLLDYSTDGNSLMLAEAPLKAGHYTMIRLMLSSASIVVGGETYPVDISNVTSTGVKCNGQFTVGDNQLMALMLDFNAGKSFVNNPVGSTNYKLHPVMVMSPVNMATVVTGTVAVKNADSTAAPIPDGTTIDVYTQGHVGEADYLVSGAEVDLTTGDFRISMLPQGTYDFRVTAGTVTKDLLATSVNPPSTDLGTIEVQLP